MPDVRRLKVLTTQLGHRESSAVDVVITEGEADIEPNCVSHDLGRICCRPNEIVMRQNIRQS
jgi:hypothetical protein